MKAAKLFLWVVTARRTLIVALLCCAAALASCELAIPWLVQEAIDAALGYSAAFRLDFIGGVMIAVICVLYIVHCIFLRVEGRLLYEGLFRLRHRLYTDLLSQPLAFFSKARSGEVLHRVVNDTDTFEHNAAEIFSGLPFELMTIAGVVILMALTDLRLGASIITFLIVATFISAYMGRSLPTLRHSLQSVGAGFSARLQETLSGIRTVKAFGRERFEMDRLEEANRQFLSLDLRGARLTAFLDPVFDLVELLGVVLVVWYGAHLVIKKQITPGALVAFLAYMEILAGPVSRMDKYYGHFQKCRAVCDRLARFLSDLEATRRQALRPMTNRAADDAVRLWPIVFEEVRFTYPGGKHPAIERLSLVLEPGETVAIVGRNGAGKSTLMDLLLRFYDPDDGRIMVGGLDLRQWDMNEWRAIVGVMTQDVFLFHATIAENIAYARPAANAQEVQASAFKAGLQDMLDRLPMGMQTVVGDRGNRLSGGERQRIALARLFLKDPKILIFDEPTTHMDGEILGGVAASMERLSNGRTTVLITHQPRVMSLASRIVLLDGGQVLAAGRHEVLLQTSPLYGSLLATWGRERTGAKHSGRILSQPAVV